MKYAVLTSLLTVSLTLSACGSVIYNAKFELEDDGDLPHVQPTGNPSGDRSYVAGGFDVLDQSYNIGVTGNHGPVITSIGGSGKSLTFWPVQPSTGSNGLLTLVSTAVDSNSSRKTAFWNGKKEINAMGFRCTFAGRSSNNKKDASTFPIVAVVFDKLDILVEDGAPRIIGSVVPRPEGQDASEHSVFVTYNPTTNQYKVSIKQVGEPEINATGTATSTAAKTAPHFSLTCNQGGFGPSFLPTYMMDDVIMREKN